MSKIINNVDLDKVVKTTEDGKKEKLTLQKPVKLYGEHRFISEIQPYTNITDRKIAVVINYPMILSLPVLSENEPGSFTTISLPFSIA
jgi:hypothetical protein